MARALVVGLALAGSALPLRGEDPELPDAFVAGLHFRSIGPHRGGRVTAVTGVARERGTFYMGSTGGGVWRTTDYGVTWSNLSDGFFEVASIGAIDVADSDPNVVWVGTGSACIRSNIVTGRGVYRSTDAGQTWSHMGLRDAGAIGDLVVHKDDPDRAWVAVLGHPFGPNEVRGVYRTKDGGENWQRVLYISEHTGAVDLAVDPRNPRRIFASMWRAERKPWTILSGSEESGLFVSKNGGDDWTQVVTGLPEGMVGKIAVEISPADSDRVWALIEAPGDERGLYRSDDAGNSFTLINTQPSLTYRPWYYTHLTADPLDKNRLWVNNESLWLSVDGGKTFERRTTPHGDNHAQWIHPDDPDLMVQGNDGGVAVTTNGGASWSSLMNQPTAELYQVAVDNGYPYRVYGAQQDNTTISVPSRISNRPLDPKQLWREVSGCETGPVVPHPDLPGVVYGGCKGRHSVWESATGASRQFWVYPHYNYGHDTREMPFRFQRTAPMIVSPHDSSVLYHGSHVVHRTRNEGRSWDVISPDLTRFDDESQGYSGGPITRDITGEEVYSAIYAITESPLEKGVLFVGSNDGPIHISRDDGGEWTDITPDQIPYGGRVNRIEASPHARGRAYAAIYRYQLDDWTPYLLRTDDYGRSWRLLTNGKNGIPDDEPVRVVREDPEREGLLYVGTEFGLYVSLDGGANFQELQGDLPRTPISGLMVHRGDLVLATMGRSFFILDDLGPIRQWPVDGPSTQATVFDPGAVIRARGVSSLERSFPGFAPEYPDTGVALAYWLPDGLEAPLEVRILDSDGEVVRSFVDPSDMGDPSESEVAAGLERGRGLHRFRWDFRVQGPRSLEGEGYDAGPMVPPGRYTARFESGVFEFDREFELVIDPRSQAVGVSPADLEAQFELARKVALSRDRLRAEVERIRQATDQLEHLAQRLEVHSVQAESSHAAELNTLREQVSTLGSSMTSVEGRLIQLEKGKVGAELEPQLESQYGYLYGMLQTADQRPGADAYARFTDLEEELGDLLRESGGLFESDMGEVQAAVARLGVPAVAVREPR